MSTTEGRAQLDSFLTQLWPNGFQGMWALFWGAPSKKSLWVPELTPDVLDQVVSWGAKENVYLGCGLRGADLGPTLRGKFADVTAIPGLWLDIDYGTEHKKPNLPPTEEDAVTLIRDMGPSPSLIVHSGRGLQAWWLFREPWIFDGDQDRTAAEALTMGWCNTLRARAKAKGWDADQVGDLPRVMRLPGLWNHKGVKKPTVLRPQEGESLRYNPGEFGHFLLTEEAEGKSIAQISWKFELKPAADPPAEKFAALMELDTRFKLAWQHARTDFQDQSLSSYDMALATRAFAAGWNGQEIVDLLLAHRRKYKGDPEKSARRDYFERTLNAAISGKDEEVRRQTIDDLKAGKPLPDEVLKDPAELLALISEQLGVPVQKFVRYRTGEANTYKLTVMGLDIAVPSVKELDSQTEFRRLLLDHTGIRILPLKPMEWHSLITNLFRAVEDVDSSMANKQSSYKAWIEHFLTMSRSGVGDESRWQDACIQGAPFLLKGATWIPTHGFLRFVKHHMMEQVTAKQLAIELVRLGYEHEVKKLRNQNGVSTSRGCWKVL